MSEIRLYKGLLVFWFALAAATFATLFFVTAPYGRHSRKGWGPSIKARSAWVIMEAPAALVFALCFALGPENRSIASLAFLALWEAHYIYRAFLYPWRLSHTSKYMPVAVAAMGFLFNGANGYLNGRYLFAFSGGHSSLWLGEPRFLAGAAVFVIGGLINRRADRTLRDLRQPGESGYKIPEGGLYRWISCPNYLGEIIEWVGWAIATWSLSGLAFAVWVIANLVPRARAHHCWYRAHFANYPPERKALVPGLW